MSSYPTTRCQCGFVTLDWLMERDEAEALAQQIARNAPPFRPIAFLEHQTATDPRYHLRVGQYVNDVCIRRLSVLGTKHWAYLYALLTRPIPRW